MSDEKSKIHTESKRKRSAAELFLIMFRRSFYVVLTTVLLLCFLIISVTQIPAFRQWALGFAQEAVNAELNGRIEIGDIEFH